MNGRDFAREQNMEARIRLVAARRELADAVNDATIGIGCLTCDDPQTMNQSVHTGNESTTGISKRIV